MEPVRTLSLKEIEDQIERLNPTVRGCIKHNNKAQIEADMQGEVILAVECGCYMDCNTFDSLEEAVNWWNERPYVDELVRDYASEFGANRFLRLELDEFVATLERISQVFVKMASTNSISIIDLERTRSMTVRALDQVKAYRARLEEEK